VFFNVLSCVTIPKPLGRKEWRLTRFTAAPPSCCAPLTFLQISLNIIKSHPIANQIQVLLNKIKVVLYSEPFEGFLGLKH
jgi:hypothetical protein